jgi:MoaA/NifB/PqqE/SkfB family radical SAM enzyme
MNVSPQDLREASTVTTTGSGEQIEIQLGHLCNNRCVFCTSGQLSEMGIARQISVDPAIVALESAARRGVRKVTFLGGEPTLQRGFMGALRRAVELGFSDIVIFTNGVTSAHRKFIEQVVALGRFTWRFSIQGGNAEAHDAVTLQPGSFQRIIDGLTHLQELGQPVTANMCVNELSYRSLPDYPDLVRKYGVQHLHIDMVRPAQSGVRSDEYLQSILPRFSEMAPYLRTMLERFEAVDDGFDINIGNFPYCVMTDQAHKIHHGGELTLTHTVDAAGVLSEVNKYVQQRSDMVHPPQCERCVFRPHCRGIADKYLQFYGDSEFQPVSLDELTALDVDRNFFVIALSASIDALLEARLPDGWKLRRVFRATRDRFVEIIYSSPRSEELVIRIAPPAGRGRHVDVPLPLLEGELARIGFTGSVERQELVPFLGWLAEEWCRITSPVPSEVVARETLQFLTDEDELLRRRVALAGYAKRLGAADSIGEWKFLPRPGSHELQVKFDLTRSSTEQLKVVLSGATAKREKRVEVSFDGSSFGESPELRHLARKVIDILTHA